ncbi:MAG: hypothetical protein R3B99_37585 [Polyangiales bacterium]
MVSGMWARALFVGALVVLTGCDDVYDLGSSPDGAVDAGLDGGVDAGCVEGCGHFVAPLASNGTSALEPLDVLVLAGEDATDSSWPARVGSALSGASVERDVLGPFTDATRGNRGRWTGAVASASSLELVFAAPLDGEARLVESGVRVAVAANELMLDGAVVSTLDAGAWYHVVIVSDGASARATVNGASSSTATFTLGGTLEIGDDDVTLAWVAFGRTALDDSVVRDRFARLTGVRARESGGDPVPVAMERGSSAFTDLVQGGVRRLHRVGARWPRLACRPDAPAESLVGATVCGYFAEGATTLVSPSIDTWPRTNVSVVAGQSPSDAVPGFAVVSEGVGVHELRVAFGAEEERVLSFFARPVDGGALELDLGSARARFGLDGSAPTTEGTLEAHDEDWGDGWRRVWLAADATGLGDVTLRLVRGGATDFAFDGALLHVAGVQLESNRRDPTSIGPRDADVLAYATDGNVPSVPVGRLEASVLVAGWPRLHDGTVVHFARADQVVNLYYSVSAQMTFAATGDAFVWNLPSDPIRDGRRIPVVASWAPEGLVLDVRGVSDTRTMEGGVEAAALFDRFFVGVGGPSGELVGLVSDVSIR